MIDLLELDTLKKSGWEPGKPNLVNPPILSIYLTK